MKRGFPNSAETRQNFVNKYNAVSMSINNIFSLLTCQLGLSSAMYSSGLSCWSPEGISEHESASDYSFSHY